MRLPALAIPAIIIGANGLLLGFCNLTGLWQAWALLWPIEPLSIGLGLLVLAFLNKSHGTRVAAVVLFIIAGGGFFIMSFVSVFNYSILRFGAPLMLIMTGVILAALSFFKRKEPVSTQQEPAAQ
jgi:predicted membrane protein